MFIRYNANPEAARVGDCTVRAIATVLQQDWETTYIDMCDCGLKMHDMPSSNRVWGEYLKKKVTGDISYQKLVHIVTQSEISPMSISTESMFSALTDT